MTCILKMQVSKKMNRQNKIVALLLAAGFSSRMGEFKPLLKLDGITVIESAINSFRVAGIQDIRVVVGHRAAELVPLLRSLGVMAVLNTQYASGMFSSVCTGLATFVDQADGFFLLPGDMPLVKGRTIDLLLEAYRENDGSVIYPNFLGKRGHPPLITFKCFNKILSVGATGTLQSALQDFAQDAYDVEVIDQAILWDMDTPLDYQKILRRQMQNQIPTNEECKAIFSKYKVADAVIRHGSAVANWAWSLSRQLNQCGYCLNEELVTAAGLLHDIAKGRRHHAEEGAAILAELGFSDVAKIVATHTDLQCDPKGSINEAMIVYLADKLIKNTQVVSLTERFAAAFERYRGNPEALRNIEQRKNQALSIKQRVERCLKVKDLSFIFPDREAER